MGEDFWHFYWTFQNGWHWKVQKLSSNKWEGASTSREVQSDCWQQQKDGSPQRIVRNLWNDWLISWLFGQSSQQNLSSKPYHRNITFAWHLFYLGKSLFACYRWNHGIVKPKCDVPRENLPWEMSFTVLCITAPRVSLTLDDIVIIAAWWQPCACSHYRNRSLSEVVWGLD